MTLGDSHCCKSMSLNILTRFHIKILITPMKSILNFLLGISSISISSASTRNWQGHLYEGIRSLKECLRHTVLHHRYSPHLFSSVDLSHSVLSHLQISVNLSKLPEFYIRQWEFSVVFLFLVILWVHFQQKQLHPSMHQAYSRKKYMIDGRFSANRTL